jgi:hypothetical protein
MLRFDTFPLLYWLPCCLFCLGLVWVAFRTRFSDARLVGVAVVLLFLLRLPSLVYNREINPDESQMITQGRTLAIDPVYFRSVDGTTIGPLDSYALIIPSWFGLSFDYIAARLLGFGLIAGSLIFLFLTARRWFGSVPARMTLLLTVFALGLTQNGDLLSYCSELVPVFLLSIGTWLFARIEARPSVSLRLFFLVGVLIGATPLGKVQGVPLAFVLGLFVFFSLLTKPGSLQTKLLQAALFAVGIALVPAAFIGMVAANGLYDDFWTFYIEGNLRYGGNTSHWQNMLGFGSHLAKGEEFGWLMVLATLLGGWAMVYYSKLTQRPLLTISWLVRLGFIGFSLLGGFFAVTRTGTEFVHYFYFLLGPLFLIIALSGAMLQLPNPKRTTNRIPLAICLLFLGAGVAKGLWHYSQNIPLNPYPTDNRVGFSTPQPPIVQQIRKYAAENEPLVVWGWRCDYYVSAAMPQGTAENHSERCVFVSPMTPVYQQRYLNDFLRSKPPVFVDAVGSQNAWLTDRATQGFEIIKPLAAFVQKNYRYMGLYNDARLYVRNDRLNHVD